MFDFPRGEIPSPSPGSPQRHRRLRRELLHRELPQQTGVKGTGKGRAEISV